MLEILLLLVVLTVFLIFGGLTAPKSMKRDATNAVGTMPQFRPRSIGKSKLFEPIVAAGVRRALRKDSTNTRYLRHLRQANWYWEPGEPIMPNPKAPFWNLETLWGEKFFGALVKGGIVAVAIVVLGMVLALSGTGSPLLFVAGGVLVGGVVGMMNFSGPDGKVAAAAIVRQRELALEMGFRIPELRADVMAGNTIQRAIRSMSRRPGGPFVEELRRAVAVLDITKDDTLAMDQLIERSDSNELLIEFANSLKMVSRQGGQIGPVLNVLADLAQQRLRLTIQGQARKNLQEMTRPIGLSNLIVTSLLIIAPAMVGVMGSMIH